MKKLLILLIFVSFSVDSLFAQTKTIKGRVIDDFLEPISGVLIKINDTSEVGKTDLNGYFQIEIPVSVIKITFMYIGYERGNIELMDNYDGVEVIMMSIGTYDFMSIKKENRLRKKRFKQLPDLHKQAFEKSIFKTKEPCYKQDFITIYNKKQKK